MLNIQLQGDYEKLYKGVKALESTFSFSINDSGTFKLYVKKREEVQELEINCDNEQATITFQHTHHFFRGFGILLEQVKQENTSFNIKETPQFQTVGPMFDFSRNGILNQKAFESMVHRLAIMGFNAAMLYMEDTYEVPSEPYFGYMRGRNSYKELKEMDDYAHQFGIELIPCIQTLAHLEEFLKWDAALSYKDTRGALLLKSEKTYELLKNMIQSVSSPFKSKRIHIGMDEAEEVGRGIYLNKHGYTPRIELMTEHLKRVLQITDQLDLEVTMWSDMFLKLASETGDNYSKTTEIPEYIIEQTPENVQLMYWQYASTDIEHYHNIIAQHKAFRKKPAFAGGTWIWNTFATNYHMSLQASEAALSACKEGQLDDVFVTLWGDDGQETGPFNALLGLLYYAEHAYHENVEETWKERAAFCTGLDAESYMLLSELDRPPGVKEESVEQTNPSKFLLWQDVLLGVFDKHIEGLPVGKYYQNLKEKIQQKRKTKQDMDFILNVPEKLCDVLEWKAEVGVQIKQAYDKRDQDALQQIVTIVLPEISDRVKVLREAHREQWFRVNKPFGWEVIDIRYGGVINRIDTAMNRITDYLNNKINRIEELEQERLYYSPGMKEASTLGWSSYYYRMATPNVFFHVLPIY